MRIDVDLLERVDAARGDVGRTRWMERALEAALGGGVERAGASRSAIVDSQRAGCERGKLDRSANADGWTAHQRYIEAVLEASSVKGDVKEAARRAIGTYMRISGDLRRRARIECAAQFPKPPFLDL